MSRSIVPVLRAAALVAVALVLAHQAVFLARYGSVYGEALQHSGHGAAWSEAVATVLIGSVVILAGSLLGLYRLGRQVADRTASGHDTGTSYAIDLALITRQWLRTALAIGAGTLVLLSIQENVEHLSAGLGLPGPAILLSPEYPFAVAITLGAALAVALVSTLLSWRRAVLLRRLRALATEPRRRPIRLRQPRTVRLAPRRVSILARRLGRRAPPVLLAA